MGSKRRLIARAIAVTVLAVNAMGLALDDARAQVESSGEAGTLAKAVEIYGDALAENDANHRRQLFRRAQSLYRRAIDERERDGIAVSSTLLTDWGNAALQAGDLGAAVLGYRRALDRPSVDERANRNLTVARTLIESATPTRVRTVDDSILGRLTDASDDDLALAAALLFLAMALALGHHLRSPNALARAAGVLFGIGWAGLLVFTLTRSEPAAVAVITASGDGVIARVADADGAPQKYSRPIPSGVEVEVLEPREAWTRVRFGDGDTAWVRTSALTRVDAE